jgi:hypothetical protein
MEQSQFIAFCPFRDETLQRIDEFLTKLENLEKDSEATAAWNQFATSETPPEDPAMPTGYMQYGKLIPWNGISCGWLESARHAADFLCDAQEIVEAKGIYSELDKIPTKERDWERLHDHFEVMREAALQVKAILTAICPVVPDGSHGAGSECLVTLLQAASMVSRSKKTLERKKASMPLSRVEGGGGKPDEWAWSELRPWLEKEFSRKLPEQFPADRFRQPDGQADGH